MVKKQLFISALYFYIFGTKINLFLRQITRATVASMVASGYNQKSGIDGL